MVEVVPPLTLTVELARRGFVVFVLVVVLERRGLRVVSEIALPEAVEISHLYLDFGCP